jgi:hypothetical protein
MLMLCLLWLDRHMKGNSPVAALFGSAQAPRFPDISVTIFFFCTTPCFSDATVPNRHFIHLVTFH